MGKKLGILAAIFGIILAVGIIVWKIPKPKNEPQEFPSEYTEEETIKYKVPESPVSHVMEAEGKSVTLCTVIPLYVLLLLKI